MQVRFHGKLTTEEAAAHLASVLKLFKEHYAIKNFSGMYLTLNLLNDRGEHVELIDLATSEVLQIFDIYQSDAQQQPLFTPTFDSPKQPSHLRLVVDNTKNKNGRRSP